MDLSIDELYELGYQMYIEPTTLLGVAANAMVAAAEKVRTTGRSNAVAEEHGNLYDAPRAVDGRSGGEAHSHDLRRRSAGRGPSRAHGEPRPDPDRAAVTGTEARFAARRQDWRRHVHDLQTDTYEGALARLDREAVFQAGRSS